MSKTDGLLLEKINSIEFEKLYKICTASVAIWFFSPLISILANAFNITSYTYHGIIIVVLYLSGCIGLIFGGIYVYRFVTNYRKSNIELDCLVPLLILFLMGLWCAFSTLFANEKRVAIYGYESLRDNLFTFMFYGGLVLSGFVVSFDKKKLKILINILCFSSMLFAIFMILVGLNIVPLVDAIEDDSFYGEFLVVSAFASVLAIDFTSKGKCIYFLIYISQVIATVLIGDYISVLVLLLVLLFLFLQFLKRKDFSICLILFLFIIVLVLVFFVLSSNNQLSITSFSNVILDTIEDRKSRWQSAVTVIGTNSIVGLGPQNTMQFSKNIFLQIGIFLGVPGVLIFLLILLSVWKNIELKEMDRRDLIYIGVILAFLLMATLLGTIYYVLAYFFVFLGIIIGRISEKG